MFILKKKALTTFMATAMTAAIVLPAPVANASASELSANNSQYSTVHTAAVPSGETTLTITNVTASTVSTSSGPLSISKSLKSIFNADNRLALQNARATVVVKNGEITDIKALTLNKSGTSKKAVVFNGGNATISGSLTASADYLQIENITIDKDLIVTNRVKKSLKVDNAAIDGTIKLNPYRLLKASTLTISLEDVEETAFDVQRNKVKLISDQSISSIHVKKDVTSLTVEADIDEVTVDVDKNFSLRGNGNVDKAIVKRGTNVSLDSDHKITKVQVDDAKANVTLASADKTAINNLLASLPYVAVSTNGDDVSTTEKWTTQAARTAFDTAVLSTQAVARDTKASQAQVTTAITTYNNALATYQAAQSFGKKYGNGDKATLTSLINSVQYVTVSYYGNYQSYNTAWTTQAEKDALVNAVSSARNVANNYYASQYEISNAYNNLNNAITTYKNAHKYGNNGNNGYNGDKSSLTSLISSVQSQYVTVSWNNGSDVSYNTTWTTQAEKDALVNAVSSAQGVVNNYNASQYDISNAYSNLNNALSTYNNAKKYGPYGNNGNNGYYGDKSQLTTLYYSISYVDVSSNYGYGLPSYQAWTTQGEKDALVNAATSAKYVLDNSGASQYDISNAYSNLTNAINTYNAAKRYGYNN